MEEDVHLLASSSRRLKSSQAPRLTTSARAERRRPARQAGLTWCTIGHAWTPEEHLGAVHVQQLEAGERREADQALVRHPQGALGAPGHGDHGEPGLSEISVCGTVDGCHHLQCHTLTTSILESLQDFCLFVR